MVFEFDFSDELRDKLEKLARKDKKKVEIINKKIREIVNNNSETIKRYKNLRHNLSDFKRVHIDKSFVLTFKVDLQKNLIVFVEFDHHDKIYNP